MVSFPHKDIVKENDTIIRFNEKENNNGPSPALILTALTLKCAGDVDLERAEFLADPYLKLAAALYIYIMNPEISNKELNNLKDDIVNNQNLCKLAVEKQLEKYLITHPFKHDYRILLCFVQSEHAKKCETMCATLSYKKIADTVEALIAIFIVLRAKWSFIIFEMVRSKLH